MTAHDLYNRGHSNKETRFGYSVNHCGTESTAYDRLDSAIAARAVCVKNRKANSHNGISKTLFVFS
jgi:hypothetical protein